MNTPILLQYNDYIIITLIGLLLISAIIQIITWAKIKKIQSNYQRLTKGINNNNLEEIIISVSDKVDQNNKKILTIDKQQQEILNELIKCIKSPQVMRYNAFDNIGSNLSFSISLLDHNKDGVILTSIYGRDESRFYAKVIEDGKSEQLLSPEEESVLK